jgi:hypothetical protein
LRSFELTLGNQVTPRLLIGYEGILITDRNEQLATRIEAAGERTTRFRWRRRQRNRRSC